MHTGSFPLPSQRGQLYEAPLYSPYNHAIPVSLPYDLIRLHQEKMILSMQLADCVTYLTALGEKQARNARQIETDTTLPQRKRKRLQQTKRHLDIEVKNKKRDEQACLTNLQACETNIILANIKAFHLANASLQIPDPTATTSLYTPTLCSQSGSDVTDLTWDGWTDEAAISPFQKQTSGPFLLDDLAPDASVDICRRDSAMAKDFKRPPPLFQDAVDLSISLPAPPNTAQSQSRRLSVLSPEATIFQPTMSSVDRQDILSKSKYKRLSMSSATATKVKESLKNRCFSAAEIVPILQRFCIDA